MSKNTGGPAFPVHDPFAAHQPGTVDLAQRLAEGMTLRDYFAAKALPGILAPIMSDECHNWKSADFASEAYAIADAMIAERAK